MTFTINIKSSKINDNIKSSLQKAGEKVREGKRNATEATGRGIAKAIIPIEKERREFVSDFKKGWKEEWDKQMS